MGSRVSVHDGSLVTELRQKVDEPNTLDRGHTYAEFRLYGTATD